MHLSPVGEAIAVAITIVGVTVAIAIVAIIGIGISVSSSVSISISAPLAVEVDVGVSWSIVPHWVEAMDSIVGRSVGVGVGVGTPLAIEKMGQAMGGWANIAGGMSRVESNSSAMGLSAPLANEMGGRVAVGEAICGGSDIAGSVAGVQGDSSAVGLGTPFANMGVTPDCGSNIAGGKTGVNCNTKTKAMRLSQGGGEEGGGENKELHVASAFLPTAGGKPQSCSPM